MNLQTADAIIAGIFKQAAARNAPPLTVSVVDVGGYVVALRRQDGAPSIRPDVATVYPLQQAAQAWKDIAANLPGVHGEPPSAPGSARRKPHGKIVLRVS